MARGRRVIRGGRSVRETLWFTIAETRTSAAAANTATLLSSLNAAALALRPFTIVRTLLHHSVRSDQTAASENFDAAVGMAVVTTQATDIGVTAVPTPFSDLGSDAWMLHNIIDGHFLFVTGAGLESNSTSPRGGMTIESKAMRKVEGGQDVIVVIENSSLSSGTQNYVAGRMLVKLH